MSTVCPRCGKENTIPFSDSVFKTHGFECEDCHKDFGVDDGTKLKEIENDCIGLDYERTGTDGDKKRIKIETVDNVVYLTPSILYANKMLQPYEKMDITLLWDRLKTLIFEQLYVLDWNKNNIGFLTGRDDAFDLKLHFSKKEEECFSGVAKLPPYLKVLDQLFDNFFATGE